MSTTMDMTFVNYYLPLLILIISFIIIFFVLKKIKVPGSNWVLAILSLVISIILVSANSSFIQYFGIVIPWMIAILVSLFLIIMVVGFFAKDIGSFSKFLAWVGIITAFIVIIIALFQVVPALYNLLPWVEGTGASPLAESINDYLSSQQFRDTAIFVIVVVIVGFFVIKK